MNAQPPSPVPPVRPAYVPTQKRARILVILLILNAVFSFLLGITAALSLFFPLPVDEEAEAEPIALAVALLTLGVAVLHLLTYVATIVVFLMWLYRSYENLPGFGVPRRDIKYSSGWAVGSFFIPFVSLVVPYRAMKELWNKSVPNTGTMFGALSPPAFFPIWWGFWLISNFANQLHFRLTMQSEMTDYNSNMFSILIALIDVPSAIFALLVVREIDKQQLESSRLVHPANTMPQAPPMPPTFDPVSYRDA